MATMRCLLVVAALTVANASAQAQSCLDCDGGRTTLSGRLTGLKTRHEGNGAGTDCLVLRLDHPTCFACGFVGKKTIEEVQLNGAANNVRLPTSGSVTVSGTLIPGETAWYCRDVGLLVEQVVSTVGAGTAGKDVFPQRTPGNGPLGYGTPSKVISDTGSWSHPTKKVFATVGLAVSRIEFYKDGTYPVFFVVGPGSSLPSRQNRTSATDKLATQLLKANSGWPFEIVAQDGRRLRYNKERSSSDSGFEITD